MKLLKRFLHKYQKAAVWAVALLLPLLSLTASNAYLSNTSVLINKVSLRKSLTPLLEAGPSFNEAIPSSATKVVFTDTTAPSGTTTVDLSDAQDGSVVGWLSGTTWYVSSQKSGVKVVANTDSSDMFRNKTSLTSIDFSNLDTSKVTTMYRMFGGCTGFTGLDLSKLNTSNVSNMALMFISCSNLKTLDLTALDTSKVTTMLEMFQNCSSLTSLNLSKFNTSSVTNFSHTFYNCTSLTSLDVTSFDTSKVTDMDFMFYNCKGLTSLDVTGFNTENVVNMLSMFDRCQELKSLDVTSFNTENVTSMSQMFQYCSSLETLDLSSFDTSNVTAMNNMFIQCKKLTTIYALENPDVSKVKNSSDMFKYCEVLKGTISYDSTKLNVKYFNFDGYLTKKGASSKAPFKRAVEEQNSPELLTGSELNLLIPDSATAVVFTDQEAPADVQTTDLSALQDGSIVGWLEDSIWYMSSQSEEVKIRANTDCSYLFSEKTELVSIDLSNLDMSSIEECDGLFAGCESLQSIYVLEDPNLGSLISGEDMFTDCINLIGSIRYDEKKTSAEYFSLNGYLSLKPQKELDENRNDPLLN